MIYMATVDIKDDNFEEKVLKSDKPVLVDFWAPWCGPCKMAEPALEELAEQYENKIAVMKLNVDNNQESAGKYSVMSIPTTILFKEGKEIGRQIGFSGKNSFEDLMKKGL